MTEYIESLPAAGVAPVARGHWERDRDTIKCSECGFGMFPNHCPDCGVRMEVEPHEQPESNY